MKHLIITAFLGSAFVFFLSACQKESSPVVDPQSIDESTLSKINTLGFSTKGVRQIPEGYLVEGDIILTAKDLAALPESPSLRLANEEQYRTFNLVDVAGTRTITVSAQNATGEFSIAVDSAIKRYNNENLSLKFSRVASGGNINIVPVSSNSYIASAGFPSGGNPYGTINYSTTYQSFSIPFMTTVIAHEMGHCIGFRHTDYMRRSYSCGVGGNEGGGTIGAVLIPNTPSGPDAKSWMLACLSASTNRPFNLNDIKALNFLY